MLEEPQCRIRGCKHFLGVKNNGDETTERVVCEAFPNGVPDNIAYGENEHIKPFPGDHGIRFEAGEQ